MNRLAPVHFAIATALTALPQVAMAHTGHGTSGLFEGLAHPLGLDHLLAMFAVGVWSVAALPLARVWQGPLCFCLAMVVGALLGVAGIGLPFVEQGIALSVVLFGVLLVVASRAGSVASPAAPGLLLVASAASLHGLAHGAEAPAGDFTAYALGFMLTTLVLQGAGVATALGVRRWLADRDRLAFRGVGLTLGVSGVVLLGQLAA